MFKEDRIDKSWRVYSLIGENVDTILEAIKSYLHDDNFNGEKLDSSRNANVYKVNVDGKNYIFKEFLQRNFIENIKAFVIGSRSFRAFRGTQMLRSENINAPKPIAFIEKINVLPNRNILITEYLDNTEPLGNRFQRAFTEGATDKDKLLKKEVLKSLGLEIGKMHASGICHGDLRLNNILFKINDELDFYFIDNERNVKHRYLSKKLIKKNLTQLGMMFTNVVSKRDRLKFLSMYRKNFKRADIIDKEFLEEVFLRTSERMEKYGGIEK